KRIADADRAIDGVLSKQPNMPEAHNMKGVVLLLQKNSDAARKEFARAIELHPTYVTPHVHLASIARSQGDFPVAIQEYQRLVVLAPRLPAGYIGQAEAMMMRRDNMGAYKVLNAWKAADPKSVLPY